MSQHVRRPPKVSVLMAAYNRERFIAEAVASILSQDFTDFELIVVDDGSVDATRKLLADLSGQDQRIVYMHQANAGVAAARNTGLAKARGEYIAIMDSDDIALPMRLRLQVEYLEKHTEVCGVGSHYFYIDGCGKKSGPRRYVRAPDAEPMELPTNPADVRRKLLEKGVLYFLHSTAMFRAIAIRKIGGYRKIFAAAEDSDLHLRLLTAGYELANLKELLFFYRQGGGNLSAATLPVLLHRLVALAGAHRRLHGVSDLIDGRTSPFDYDFLMTLMEPVEQALWLEWIGLLQYHKNGEPKMLRYAWRHVLAMDVVPENHNEIQRHWQIFSTNWPQEKDALMREPNFLPCLLAHQMEGI